MKRLSAAAALVVLLAAAGAAWAAKPKPAPARVQVVAHEFSYSLSRRTIKSGPAIIELANFGEDPHDLHLRRQTRGAPTLRLPELGPGKESQLRAKLAPGRFVLWCSLADHRELGMEARLTVLKRR